MKAYVNQINIQTTSNLEDAYLHCSVSMLNWKNSFMLLVGSFHCNGVCSTLNNKAFLFKRLYGEVYMILTNLLSTKAFTSHKFPILWGVGNSLNPRYVFFALKLEIFKFLLSWLTDIIISLYFFFLKLDWLFLFCLKSQF